MPKVVITGPTLLCVVSHGKVIDIQGKAQAVLVGMSRSAEPQTDLTGMFRPAEPRLDLTKICRPSEARVNHSMIT